MPENKGPTPNNDPNRVNNAANVGPIAEDQLLDWIEGRLSPEEEESLAKISGRSGLAERIDQMAANRRVLIDLPDERAPAELLDRVLATLERETLIGLTTGQEVETERPALVLPKSSRPSFGGFTADWSRYVAPVSIAAGLAMLVSGGFFWYQQLKPKSNPRGGDALIALNTETNGTGAQLNGDNARTAIAANGLADEPGVTSITMPEVTLASVTRAVASIDTAASLARQGKLGLRVKLRTTKQLETNIASLEAIALKPSSGNPSRASSGRSWRFEPDPSGQTTTKVLASMLPVRTTSDAQGAINLSPEARAASLLAPLVGPAAAFNVPGLATADPMSNVEAAYLATLPEGEQTLLAMKASLEDKLNATVTLEELPDAIDAPQTIDAESVLWWTQPSSQWVRRVSVPVLIER